MKKTVSVAPMMDCTDKHEIYFLSLISKNIHLYTEMIVANAIIRGDRSKLLSFKKIKNPVTLQVGGSNPNELAGSNMPTIPMVVLIRNLTLLLAAERKSP